ncbi:beta-hydroxyacyl-ACP dehydratase [Paenibacillus larvae]|nr:beta-hydroxyacyl-ACP dehydratase [Paenibacillus larvae]MDT2303245.1 beta-hydroxyacyl-ACP dehydratase [Paenibacillus larvae]
MRPVLTADQIRDLLPHRWAFLLLDKVIELEPGKRGVGIKNVTISEPFFEGHFPKESIMPGALIIEALAQMTAVVYVTGELEKNGSQMNGEKLEVDPSSYVGYLVSLRNMKFLKPRCTRRSTAITCSNRTVIRIHFPSGSSGVRGK